MTALALPDLWHLAGGQLGQHDVPCPVCGPSRHSLANRRRKVMRLWAENPGFISFHCARCGTKGSAHHRAQIRPPVERTAPLRTGAAVVDAASLLKRRRTALRLWNEALSPRGTIVERYLAARALDLPAEVVEADVLRFHPACPFRLDPGDTVRLPTMLALMRDIITDEPCAIHRTALMPDGSGKAKMPDGSNPKKMLGPAKGAVIKLIADEEVTTGLALAEGIETALTAICVGWRPVWATGSAGAVEIFPVLAGIEALTVFADADKSQRGQKAARACARRWQSAGREALIRLPREDGSDWNDVARASA